MANYITIKINVFLRFLVDHTNDYSSLSIQNFGIRNPNLNNTGPLGVICKYIEFRGKVWDFIMQIWAEDYNTYGQDILKALVYDP